MTQGEIADVMNCASRLDFKQMDFKDSLAYWSALNEFAEKVKPLVIKYSDKLPKDITFVMKI